MNDNTDPKNVDAILSHPFVELVFAYCVCLFVFISYMLFKFFSSWSEVPASKTRRERKKKVVEEETPSKILKEESTDSEEELVIEPKTVKKGPGRPRKVPSSTTPSLRGRRKAVSQESSESSESDELKPSGMTLRSRSSNTPRSTPKKTK